MNLAQIETLYGTGKVRRWHCNPHLAHHVQTLADHQWGCAALISLLHPNPGPSLLIAAIWHDAGERWAGDIPFPVKLLAPDMAADHKDVEDTLAEQNGVPVTGLTSQEQKWIKFVDRLESYLFAKLYSPEQLMADDWKDAIEIMVNDGRDLGVDLLSG